MLFFDLLIGASVKAVKDFISHCYSRIKSVYRSLKRWLWELQGKFKAHDAFVHMCYGHMRDIESFEEELAEDFLPLEEDVERARAKLGLLIAQKAEIGVEEAYSKYFQLTGAVYAPLDYKPTVGDLAAASEGLELSIKKQLQSARKCLDKYVKEKGEGYINKYNKLTARLNFVREHSKTMAANKDVANKIKDQLFAMEDIAELREFTTVTKQDSGKTKTVTVEVDGKETKKEEPILVDVRSIKDSPEDREKAARWACTFIKMKNSSLSADELSMATIARYIDNVGERNDLDVQSRNYLTKCATIMVPLPSQQDISIKMAVQGPAARARREEMSVLDAEGF